MNKAFNIKNDLPGNNYVYYPAYEYQTGNDERFGGFVFPFLLGGVTGAAVAPEFWNNGYGKNNNPVYTFVPGYYPYPYQPYYPMFRK